LDCLFSFILRKGSINMKSGLQLLLIASLMCGTISQGAEKTSTSVEQADSFYDQGQCDKAIPAYQQSLSNADSSLQDKITFRVAYCQFTLEKYAEAESGFKNYLKKHPGEDEAQLKLAQSLLYQSKYVAAKKQAQQVKSDDYALDAAIVKARAEIETEEYREAIKTLKPFQSAEGKNAEVMYWMGVAQYRDDQDQRAEESFKQAEKLSANDSWVKSESKAWLDQMEAAKKKFHFQFTIGVMNDSNIDQSGSAVSINEGGGGGPGGPGGGQQGGNTGPGPGKKLTAASNVYTADSGGYAAVDFIHNTYSSRKFYLTTTLSGSSPFYLKNPSYNQESASLNFDLKAVPSSTFSYGSSIKYLNTWYAGYYSQDYASVTPYASWSLISDLWLRLEFPATAYLNNKKINVMGPSVDVSYQLTSSLSLSVGYSSTKSTGPEAVIVDLPPPTLTSGTMFCHYTTTGGYLGLYYSVTDTTQLSVTGSSYKTNYDLENVPTPTGGVPPKPRSDNLMSYQLGVSQTLIKDFWSANLSYSYSDNKSDGFPGLASSGSITNNSYTRGYALLTTTFYF